MYANRIVYLCAMVMDLLFGGEKQTAGIQDGYKRTNDWINLFDMIEEWYLVRPEEMKPILSIISCPLERSKPFPTLLFGNGPAVSGNQMYHTAALLMLKRRPARVQIARESQTRSISWHAQQICAISLSNDHHGCWTNSVQPLWFAGQEMSRCSEQTAIIALLRHIEQETGWVTKWRRDDLKEFWSVLDNR